MPGLDGIEAARLIKQDPELKTHPAVVLVTAFGREEVREEAERVQMDGFLLKPVTTSMLVDTLVGLFAGTREDRTALAPAVDRQADRLRGVSSSGRRQRDQPADRRGVAGGRGRNR